MAKGNIYVLRECNKSNVIKIALKPKVFIMCVKNFHALMAGFWL